MPVLNRIAEFHDEVTEWRRDLHRHPELLYDVHRTAGVVEKKLREFGIDEVTAGIGRTGVVGVIKGRETGSGKVIGLRADMDALPIQEARDIPHKSTVDGKMHACGHDGHTAMLLGAAKYLSETRNFDGTAVVIFQPAEEGGAGGDAMVKDGMMERWGIQEVYGMHNMPNQPLGTFHLRPGPMMAASDFFELTIEAKGGHAARPHECIDPIIIGAQLLNGFQTIVSRNADPIDSLVISATKLIAGDTNNVIPQTAKMEGTVRTLSTVMRDLAEERMTALCTHIGAAYGAHISLNYMRNYPVTANHPAQAEFAAQVAAGVAGAPNVDANTPQIMGGEDFSFMLNARPGAFIFLGQGDGPSVHHPDYDFNDEVIPFGCSYWAQLVETAMPAA